MQPDYCVKRDSYHAAAHHFGDGGHGGRDGRLFIFVRVDFRKD